MFEQICRRTRLTEEEVVLVCRCFNGLDIGAPHVPELHQGGAIYDRELLLVVVSGEAANAHSDMQEKGAGLESYGGDAEQPYRLNDIAEKISQMSDAQAESLIYFVLGWWNRAHWMAKLKMEG